VTAPEAASLDSQIASNINAELATTGVGRCADPLERVPGPPANDTKQQDGAQTEETGAAKGTTTEAEEPVS